MLGTAIWIPICAVLCVNALSYPEVISSQAQMENQTYFVTNQGTFGDMWTNYWFYQCNEENLECLKIYQFAEAGSQILPVSLRVDQDNHEINIFIKHDLFWELYIRGKSP